MQAKIDPLGTTVGTVPGTVPRVVRKAIFEAIWLAIWRQVLGANVNAILGSIWTETRAPTPTGYCFVVGRAIE
jgi:hypothetical protein